jgi:toxin ParE1/3/4
MAEFKLTNKAIADLANIWNYTFDTWSENQADKYYEMLISACGEIAANPTRGKIYEDISEGLFGMMTNRHIIFYRILNGSLIEITRILHERMDLRMRIEE